MRVRGFHPFRPIAPDIPADGSLSQDWIVSDDVFDSASGFFNRDTPPCSGDDNSVSAQARLQFQPTTTSADGVSSGVHRLALNEDVINDILAATRAMPSWKACEMEGTAWTGTAEENIQKHVSSIGTEDPLTPAAVEPPAEDTFLEERTEDRVR
ncbi:hypothetical protein FISHEDRAFT_35438 [Fistulina hepatica ATCC 64428]|uniref:Uncharacterized protein n=1 Tax=Fistulina hepatica ATCC 64428 TaxID=1128425 RepID=A0A0D7ALR1_9AGAR|nr:hypothetical protein FISHEDRAFT_35438 [Fistulina hepatica ATCC 64428]